jgi:hypothetical protein
LKQKKRSVLEITGFFFRMSTQVMAEVRSTKAVISVPNAEKETRYIQYGQIILHQ